MSGLLFLLYTILMGVLIWAHFYPAHRNWRILREDQPSDIDPSYVRLEDYFARSFRMKVSEWLKLPVEAAQPDGTRTLIKQAEKVRVAPSADYPPWSKSDEILVAQGAFRCGAGCTFSREIYAHQDAGIGAGSRLQSIAADGNLILGPGTRVTRWADSAADMEIGENAVVCARATAGRSIRLGGGSQVGSAFAPSVTSAPNGMAGAEKTADTPAPALDIPLADGIPASRDDLARAGVEPTRLSRLSADLWLYRGDLKPPRPVRVTSKLIVKGDCILPAGSILEGDLKAAGKLVVGARSACRGNLVAEGDIWVGAGTGFQGIVHAGGNLKLNAGVRGGSAGSLVAAFAAGILAVEADVRVHGKLAAGRRVEVVAKAV